MEYSTGKRIGAFLLVLLHVWSFPVFASTVCATTSSADSVLSVIGNSTVSFGGGACNVIMYDVTSIGAKSGNYIDPGEASNGTATGGTCLEYTSSGKTTTAISESGTSASARTLGAYDESASTIDIEFDNGYAGITYTNSAGESKTTGFAKDGSTNISDASYSVTLNERSGTRTINLTKLGKTYTLSGGYYHKLTSKNGMKIVFSGPVSMAYLSLGSVSGCNVTFAPDSSSASPKQTYVDEIAYGAACSISVSGTTVTTLNVLGKNATTDVLSGLTFNGGLSCINYIDCSSSDTYAIMNEQHPELLQINLYYGDFKTVANVKIAAAIYVASGKTTLDNPIVLVGNLTSYGNIGAQNNNQTILFYKSTSSVALQAGSYSLTPPASDPIITGGSFVYRAMQRDYLSDNTTAGTSGHLMKFALKDDTTQESTATWDAAALMTTSDRQTKIYTENAQGNFILLQNATADILTDGTQTAKVACIINPNCENGAYLAGRDSTSLVGTPWRTYPILIGDSQLASDGSANAAYKGGSVLFATDDGILYSVDRDTGALNWGWIPAKVVPMTATPASLILKHPWGQISSMSLYKTGSDGTLAEHTYVTGTALGGQLHFTIEVDNYGKSLKSVVWQDYRSGKYSPGSDAWGGIAGRPYGGAAPTAQVGGTGKVAYVVGNQLVTRQIDDTSTTVPTAYSFVWYSDDHTSGAPYWDESTMRVSSNLIYMGDSAIYFGGSNGRVWQATSLGHLKSGAVNIDLSLDGKEAITFLNGATTTSTGGNSLILLAQSTSRVTTLKYLNNAWSYNWYISVGAATGTNPYIPSANNAYISAPSDISNGSVYLYYTTKDSTGCDVKGYEFGPISLENGSSKLSSLVVGTTTSLSSYIGPGEAVGGIVAEWYSSTAKKLYVGVLAATAGTPGGSSSSSGSSSTGSSTASLSTNAQTLFLGQNTTSTTTRVNWRELTNFF